MMNTTTAVTRSNVRRRVKTVGISVGRYIVKNVYLKNVVGV